MGMWDVLFDGTFSEKPDYQKVILSL